METQIVARPIDNPPKERFVSVNSVACSHSSRYVPACDQLRPPHRLRWGISRSDIQEGFEFANRRFRLIRMIGSGSYGHIWLGQNKGKLSVSKSSFTVIELFWREISWLERYEFSQGSKLETKLTQRPLRVSSSVLTWIVSRLLIRLSVNGNEVAVKIEHHRRSNQLPQEQKIYQILKVNHRKEF